MSKLVGAGCILGIIGLLASAEGFVISVGLLLLVTWVASLVGSSFGSLASYIVAIFVANYIVPFVVFAYGKRLMQKVVNLVAAMVIAYALIIPSMIVVESGCKEGYRFAPWAIELSPIVQVIDHTIDGKVVSCA